VGPPYLDFGLPTVDPSHGGTVCSALHDTTVLHQHTKQQTVCTHIVVGTAVLYIVLRFGTQLEAFRASRHTDIAQPTLKHLEHLVSDLLSGLSDISVPTALQ
jgi:hypothetical protein